MPSVRATLSPKTPGSTPGKGPADTPGTSAPIFLTGLPRCGSSWAAAVLAGTDTRLVYEPLNHQWTPALRGHLRHFEYVPADLEPGPEISRLADRAFVGWQGRKQLMRALWRGYLRAATRKATKVLVKDPTAVLLCDWVATRYRARCLIVTRHPCGFAASVDSLDWPVQARRLLQQPRLMQDHLGSFENQLQSAGKDPWLNRGAFWGAVHRVLSRQAEARADWIQVRYEDLATGADAAFRELAARLGLSTGPEFTAAPRQAPWIRNQDQGSIVRSGDSEGWRRKLSQGQADAVWGMAQEFGSTGDYSR